MLTSVPPKMKVFQLEVGQRGNSESRLEFWLTELGGGTERMVLFQIPQSHFSYQIFIDFLE